MNELTSNGVQIYKFPTDDETVAEVNGAMNVSTSSSTSPSEIQMLPFALFIMINQYFD